MNELKPYFWRLVFIALGLVAAILFLTLGFWKAILILLCCGLGYAVGNMKDKNLRIPERLLFWRDKWR